MHESYKAVGCSKTLEKSPNAINILKNHKIEDIDARNEDGNTPLHWAARYGQTEIVQALITAGAEMDAMSKSGRTRFIAPLWMAIQRLLKS